MALEPTSMAIVADKLRDNQMEALKWTGDRSIYENSRYTALKVDVDSEALPHCPVT